MRALRLKREECYVWRRRSTLLRGPKSLTSFKNTDKTVHREKLTQRYFSFLLKSHKHSICPLLYSKTCKISTFIKGPFVFLSLLVIFSLIGRARGLCCRVRRVFFCFHVHQKPLWNYYITCFPKCIKVKTSYNNLKEMEIDCALNSTLFFTFIVRKSLR